MLSSNHHNLTGAQTAINRQITGNGFMTQVTCFIGLKHVTDSADFE